MWEVFGNLLTTLLALIVVLLLAWLVLRWLNRRMPGMGGGSTERLIKVLDRVTVGKNTVLVLVRVKNTVMLVAVGDHAVEKLAEFDAADGAFDIGKAAQQSAGFAQSPSFADALKETLAKSRFGGVVNLGGKAPAPDAEDFEAAPEGALPEAPPDEGVGENGGNSDSAAEITGGSQRGEDKRHEE